MAIAALQAPDFRTISEFEMPDWVADKQARLDKIREAKAELDAEAKSQGGG
jgi:hypothetical protein